MNASAVVTRADARPGPWRDFGSRWAGLLVAATLCAVYVVVQPASVDYASGDFRARLFGRGAVLWNNDWFAGHPLPGYGLIPPMLGALVGVVPVGIAATLAATWALTLVVGRCAELLPTVTNPTVTTVLLAFGCALNLWSGRLTFGPSVAFGAGCLACLQRRRHIGAVICAIGCGLSSPVGAVSLTIVLVGCFAAGVFPRRWLPIVVVASVAPIATLGLAFPEGGWYPFTAGSLALLLVALAAVAWAGRRERVILYTAIAYAVAALGAFAVRTPLGGNIVRLGWLAAGPVVVFGMRRHRRDAIALLAALSLLWGWSYAKMAFRPKDATGTERYYDSLATEVRRQPGGVQRVEVVPTATFRQADELALEISLARGWDTQLDRKYNAPLYSDSLDADTYHRWLIDNSVSLVALPLGPRQHAARSEIDVIRARPDYLQPLWSNADWQLYRVVDATPLATNAATVTLVQPQSLTIDAPRTGPTTVHFRYTDLYRVVGGNACITRAPGGWIDLHVVRPGPIVLRIELSASALLHPPPSCH